MIFVVLLIRLGLDLVRRKSLLPFAIFARNSFVIMAFSSPSFYSNPFKPFFDYTYCRPIKTAEITINTNNGRKDWETAIAEKKAEFTFDKRLCAFKEDAIFLMFGSSWPDSSMDWQYNKIHYANLTLRWLWFPMMILLVVSSVFIKRKPKELLIVLCSLCLLCVLLIQDGALMEGRYRKPLEPFLLLTTAIVLSRKAKKENISLLEFAVQTYIKPPTQYIIKKLEILRAKT
jgi:hypothetical protein